MVVACGYGGYRPYAAFVTQRPGRGVLTVTAVLGCTLAGIRRRRIFSFRPTEIILPVCTGAFVTVRRLPDGFVIEVVTAVFG